MLGMISMQLKRFRFSNFGSKARAGETVSLGKEQARVDKNAAPRQPSLKKKEKEKEMNLKFGKNVNYTSMLCFSLDGRVTFFTKTPVRLSHTDKLPLTGDWRRKPRRTDHCVRLTGCWQKYC